MAAKKATASLLTDNPNVKFKDISPEARHVVRTASSWRHSVARELAGASARYYLPAQLRPGSSFPREEVSGVQRSPTDHPTVAANLNNLAHLLQATNRLSEAEPLYRRAVAINEQSLGPDHPNAKHGA